VIDDFPHPPSPHTVIEILFEPSMISCLFSHTPTNTRSSPTERESPKCCKVDLASRGLLRGRKDDAQPQRRGLLFVVVIIWRSMNAKRPRSIQSTPPACSYVCFVQGSSTRRTAGDRTERRKSWRRTATGEAPNRQQGMKTGRYWMW